MRVVTASAFLCEHIRANFFSILPTSSSFQSQEYVRESQGINLNGCLLSFSVR